MLRHPSRHGQHKHVGENDNYIRIMIPTTSNHSRAFPISRLPHYRVVRTHIGSIWAHLVIMGDVRGGSHALTLPEFRVPGSLLSAELIRCLDILPVIEKACAASLRFSLLYAQPTASRFLTWECLCCRLTAGAWRSLKVEGFSSLDYDAAEEMGTWARLIDLLYCIYRRV